VATFKSAGFLPVQPADRQDFLSKIHAREGNEKKKKDIPVTMNIQEVGCPLLQNVLTRDKLE
jgi:hypothetical protein